MGFDFKYSMTFPLGIHSVRIRKDCGVVDIDTPNKGKMFRWDRRFQVTISRHNRWARGEQHGDLWVDQRYLERSVGVPFHPEMFDGHGTSLVFPIAHIRRPPVVANFTDAYVFRLQEIR